MKSELSDEDRQALISWVGGVEGENDAYSLTIEFMVPPSPEEQASNATLPDFNDGRRIDDENTWRWSVHLRVHSVFGINVDGYGPTLKAAFDMAETQF